MKGPSGEYASSDAARRLDAFRVTGSSPGSGRPGTPAVAPRRATVRSVPAAAGVVPLSSTFALALGGTLSHPEVPYELAGPPGAPVVAVLGGISANRHVASNGADARSGWWESFVGPASIIDTDRFRVLGIDYLGQPNTLGDQVLGESPLTLSPPDQARALRAVVRHLRLPPLTAVIGSSLGGTVALSFALHYPKLLHKLVMLGAAHRPHPMATSLRALQRRIVRFGREVGSPGRALALARALAHTTYRSPAEFAERFDPFPTDGLRPLDFECDRYLTHNADRWAERFDIDCFLLLSECLDAANENPSKLTVPTTAISFQDDAVTPSWLVRQLVEQAPEFACQISIQTRYGHDAFLKEVDALAEPLRGALEGASAS
ncbi:MAG: alpha/beta fold hydrolase [Longimicrobiales bacterium]